MDPKEDTCLSNTSFSFSRALEGTGARLLEICSSVSNSLFESIGLNRFMATAIVVVRAKVTLFVRDR